MDQHLLGLWQFWRIRNLYNHTDEQLGNPLSLRESDHLGTFTLNLKLIHYGPLI